MNQCCVTIYIKINDFHVVCYFISMYLGAKEIKPSRSGTNPIIHLHILYGFNVDVC